MAQAKGYDDSPPRNGVIFFYTVLAVAFLLGAQILLDSYFAKMMDAEVHEKVLTRGLDHAIATKAHEQEALEEIDIRAAMRSFAQRGRSASPVIASESGAGKPQVSGWSQLKRELPAAPPAAAATPTPEPTNVAPLPAEPSVAQPVDAPGVRRAPAPAPGRTPVAPATRPSTGAGAAPSP